MLRLDHIFVTPAVEVVGAAPVRTPLARIASDHFPLVADVRVAGGPLGAGEAWARRISLGSR